MAGNARDSFLNIFFGQKGTSQEGSNVERAGGGESAGPSVTPVGRDVSGEKLVPGGFGGDGNSAVFDMKSLGKHIEAVSLSLDR